MPRSCARSRGKDLSGIHQAVRVERHLDRPHDIDGFAELIDEIVDLAEPDAMLARAGAVHRNGASNHAGLQRFGAVNLVRLCGVDQDQHVEIAITDMPDDRSYETVRIRVLSRL